MYATGCPKTQPPTVITQGLFRAELVPFIHSFLTRLDKSAHHFLKCTVTNALPSTTIIDWWTYLKYQYAINRKHHI